LRHLSTQGIAAVFKQPLAAQPFPLGILAVNVAGSLIIGFLFGAFEIRAVPANLRLFLITGLSAEAREKLQVVRPLTVGQAARIPGVRQGDIALLMVMAKKEQNKAPCQPSG
jgi:hypothetical protein